MQKIVLSLVLPILPLVSCAAQSSAPPSSHVAAIDPFLQITERVDAHVWIMRQAQPNFAGVVGNVTIIEQSRGIVLVDSGSSHGDGQRVVASVRGITSKPVTAVIITHWHNDHPLGLSAIREAWPNIEIIASEATREDLVRTTVPDHRDPAWEARRIETLTHAYVDQIQPQVRNQSLSPEEHAGWANALHALSIRAADTPGTYLVAPTRTFRESLALPDSMTPIEITFAGRAHTAGDVEVWLPRQRVLVAGDTVVWPIPYFFNAYPAESIAVLQRLRARDFAVLIPGHGEPQRDKAFIDLLIQFIGDVRARVTAAVAHGESLEAVTGNMHSELAPYAPQFAGDNRWYRYWFEQYALDPLVEDAYHEARSEPLGPPPLAAQQ